MFSYQHYGTLCDNIMERHLFARGPLDFNKWRGMSTSLHGQIRDSSSGSYGILDPWSAFPRARPMDCGSFRSLNRSGMRSKFVDFSFTSPSLILCGPL